MPRKRLRIKVGAIASRAKEKDFHNPTSNLTTPATRRTSAGTSLRSGGRTAMTRRIRSPTDRHPEFLNSAPTFDVRERILRLALQRAHEETAQHEPFTGDQISMSARQSFLTSDHARYEPPA